MGDLNPLAGGPASPAGTVRRWAADPLTLLGLTALAATGTLAAVGAAAASLPGATLASLWWVPALFAVVAAGLALSGST